MRFSSRGQIKWAEKLYSSPRVVYHVFIDQPVVSTPSLLQYRDISTEIHKYACSPLSKNKVEELHFVEFRCILDMLRLSRHITLLLETLASG
jgi:hypothetical protein